MASIGCDLLTCLKVVTERQQELKRLVKKGVRNCRIASKFKVPVIIITNERKRLGI